MLTRGYNRPPKRKLIPQLFSNILRVIADADRPLTQQEIVEGVAERLDRCDEELKRQITVALNDALIYGYLRIKDHCYSVVTDCLDPSERRAMSSSAPQQKTSRDGTSGTRVQRSVSVRLDTSSPHASISYGTAGASDSDEQRLLERRSRAQEPAEEGVEPGTDTAPTFRHRLPSSQSRRPSELE
ncbi:uncharacterized protein LOC117590692 [Drosophila guanche]|uniref:DUF4777 domain-containing protein n=1 Tax=Drosophila guanche TaxID=7266 RepID=A0A3B0KR92_DROGU|nr:uncharacterized protein LOC117590692 [Drosophila guanche]SPP89159.1 Hypothetical predicted protein [Drosophila guanche]